MSTPADKLRLGPVPKVTMTKMTFSCTTILKNELERYAAMHSKIHQTPVDAAALIPLMLAAFMEQDQAFKRAGRPDRRSQPNRTAAPAPRPPVPAQ
jgi:hypothetical protein